MPVDSIYMTMATNAGNNLGLMIIVDVWVADTKTELINIFSDITCLSREFIPQSKC